MTVENGKPIFSSPEELDMYIENIVAEFVRDCESDLDDHPIDYDSHWYYIRDVYREWAKDVDNSDE